GLGKKIDGKDAPGPNDVLGYVDWNSRKTDALGVWVERILDRRNQYMKYLETLIDAGLIANSTEAIEDGVVTTKSGEIKAWPLRKDTLTVMPMEPRMMTENVISAVKGLARTYPNLEALLPEGSEDSTHDATVGNEGGEYQDIQLRAQAILALE
ncbi:MAG: hypothetical protein ACYTBJ_15405, partial [Planctomycetota bacterium]